MKAKSRIYEDAAYLSEAVGERLTGSENERKAVLYLKERFSEYTGSCRIEEFPVMQRYIAREELLILIDGEWVEFPVCLYNLSPSTNGETVEAELVKFVAQTDIQRPDLSYLKGKAVLHYGTFTSTEHYRRIIEAEPAFLLVVDTRYTSDKCIANGLSPATIDKYGVVPIANISFFDAWRICTHESLKARFTAVGGKKPSVSANVIADIPGCDPEGGIIYCAAHTDSVAYSGGADDNASGCAIILEMARLLSAKPHRHTIRFIAFGAEEQLSLGSAVYVRRHRQETVEKGIFMCNFDSCASGMGWYRFVLNADEAMRSRLKEVYNKADIYYTEVLTPDPYNDLFPFTAAGVPGITHMKNNCDAGRFYHHQPINSMENISVEDAGKLAACAAEFISALADDLNASDFTVNSDTAQKVSETWDGIYGGWEKSV